MDENPIVRANLEWVDHESSTTDSDTAEVDVVSPAISIEKGPDFQQVLVGGDAVFTITVTNTGDVALGGVSVTDPLAPSCDAFFALLEPGASTSFDCSATGVEVEKANGMFG